MLVVFLKCLSPVCAVAHIPHFFHNQAEVFSERQGSLLRVTTPWSHNPQLLALTVLRGKNEKCWEEIWNLRRDKVFEVLKGFSRPQPCSDHLRCFPMILSFSKEKVDSQTKQDVTSMQVKPSPTQLLLLIFSSRLMVGWMDGWLVVEKNIRLKIHLRKSGRQEQFLSIASPIAE